MTYYLEPSPYQTGSLRGALGTAALPATSMRELSALIQAHGAEQLVVLGPSVSDPEALAFADDHRFARPTLGVVLVRDSVDVDLMAEAIRAGIREVVRTGDVPGIRAACARSLDLSQNQAAAAAAGASATPARVITVFAGKGGCGKSTIATNVAVALAAEPHRRTLLVDLDLSFGDVAIMLRLVPERSLGDAIPMAGRLDETGFRSLLTPYLDGLDTLLAPIGPADAEGIGPELVGEVLGVARRLFDYIVIDTPPFFSDQVLTALDMTDVYLVPATPDIQTLKNLRLTLDMFDLLEYPQDKRLVVLNQADPKVGLTQADVERAVRSPVATQLPSTRDVRISINKGVPLVRERPGHPFGKAIRGLVDTKLTKAIGVAQASVAGAAVPGPLVAVGAALGPALTPVDGDAGAPRVAAGESAKTRDMYIPAHLRRVSFFHRRR